MKADQDMCNRANYVELTASEGTIANVVTHETGCGSHNTPWVIKAQPGQVINLTMLDFSLISLDTPDTPVPNTEEPRCIAYAILREKAESKTLTVCGGKKAKGHIYESVSDTLDVIILGNPSAEPSKHFLLHYKGMLTTSRGGKLFGNGDS